MYTAQRGSTLVEQLAILSILGISSVMALPGLMGLLADAKRTATVNELLVTVQLARSEAIKRRVPVALCASADGKTCSVRLADWGRGWIMYADDDAGVVLARGGPTRAGQTVLVNRLAFAFKPFGMRSTNGSFVVCDPRGGAQARAVVVSPTGRPRVTRESSDGKPLKCS